MVEAIVTESHQTVTGTEFVVPLLSLNGAFLTCRTQTFGHLDRIDQIHRLGPELVLGLVDCVRQLLGLILDQLDLLLFRQLTGVLSRSDQNRKLPNSVVAADCPGMVSML